MKGIRYKFGLQLLFLGLLCSFAAACKKEKDTEYPKVSIILPAQGSEVFIPDTITAGAVVSDNEHLEYVKMQIGNENYVPVTAAAYKYLQSKSETVYLAIMVDDLQLASGDYYLMVTASDGVQEKTEYRKIRLYELPRKFNALMFSSPQAGNQLQVYRVDTLFNKQLLTTLQGDFGGAAVNSANQAYYATGNATGNLYSIKTDNGAVNWTKPANGTPPQTYWTGIATYSNRIYVSSSDNKIEGFGKDGSTVFSVLSGYRPYNLHRQGNKVFSEQRQVGTNQKKLAVYLESTGGFLDEVALNITVVGFCERDDNNVLVFGNEGNQGYMMDYDIEANGFWEPHPMPPGKVYSAVRVDANNYLIAHETGILWYKHNPNSLVNIVLGLQLNTIRYDDVDSIIISAGGNQIYYHGFPNGNLINMISHTDTIRGLDLVFNR